MFQFRRFPTHTYLIQYALPEVCSGGFPHSDISGSTLICSSPKLFAAYHVLHRLLMPRHSPCALIRLTSRQKKLHIIRFRRLAYASRRKLIHSVLLPLRIRSASLGSNSAFSSCRYLQALHRKIHLWFLSFSRIMQAQ